MTTKLSRTLTIAAAASPLALLTPTSLASTPLTYDQVAADFDFVTIGALGNRTPNAAESPLSSSTTGLPYGRVDYKYRIARTEVTVEQHVEFLHAYEPFYYEDNPNVILAGPDLEGRWIISQRGAMAHWHPYTDPSQYATSMGFAFAARYVNWLHNGKVNERWAFETGVYDDPSVFENTLPYMPPRHIEPAPGARFWIPSFDEWSKAAYYDPDRYGPGEEGYWLYPTSSNTEPVDNLLPEDGGERNAFETGDPLPVVSFPHVQSPWGLLDLAGGEREWIAYGDNNAMAYNGTSYRDRRTGDLNGWPDRLEFAGSDAWFGNNGLRLATVVPSPGTIILWSAACCLVGARRRS